jgi:uncharacterized protein
LRDFGTALALVLVIEGLAWAAFPEAMKRMMAQLIVTPSEGLRVAGVLAAMLGLGGIWLIRSAMITP